MAKDTNKGASSGSGMGVNEEIDNFFADESANDDNSSALNRNELMELTGKELAKMAQPYSTLRLNSLERKSKAYLCDLILNKNDRNEEEKKPHARASQTQSETEQFISTALLMLSAIKQNRDGEPLNAMASEVFKKQAVAYADEKVSKDEIDINKASTALFAISATALLVDGLIGFKNAPTLFNKMKDKFIKRGQKNDTK